MATSPGTGGSVRTGTRAGAASILRLAIAVGVVIIGPTVTGFAWAQVLGPLVIFIWRPFRAPKQRRTGSRGELSDEHVEQVGERGLLSGLVLSSAASQALLLAGPLVAGGLGASAAQFSITYATLTLARAPLTLGYNLIARVLPPFTEMASDAASAASCVRGREAWALREWPWQWSVPGSERSWAHRSSRSPSAPASGRAQWSGRSRRRVWCSRRPGCSSARFSWPTDALVRLAVAWFVAVAASIGMLFFPIDDPVLHVMVAFVVGEGFALAALVVGALMRDPEEGEISHGYAVAKRSLDIAVALIAMLLLAPVLVLSAIAVKLDSRGPAFFRQLRTGRDGIDFWMVKLRTMQFDHDDAVFHDHLEQLQYSEDDNEYTIKIEDDPRVTRVGGFLRRWSLDELPNLWNVLKGSMSLVGPRPLVPEEADLVGLDDTRFVVKPGITGYAQVHGRDSISIVERTDLDDEYVEIRSMRVDIQILFETFGTVFRTKGEDTKV